MKLIRQFFCCSLENLKNLIKVILSFNMYYKIDKVKKRQLPNYRLKMLNDTEVLGKFYDQEFSKINLNK